MPYHKGPINNNHEGQTVSSYDCDPDISKVRDRQMSKYVHQSVSHIRFKDSPIW